MEVGPRSVLTHAHSWRWSSVIAAVSLGAMSLGFPLGAQAQGEVTCTDFADALATGITGAATGSKSVAAGTELTAHATFKVGHVGAITGLSATVEPSGRVYPMTPPAPGQTTQIQIPVPDVVSLTVTLTWSQDADVGLGTASCSGQDVYGAQVAPSAPTLRRYLRQMQPTQRVWTSGAAFVDAAFARAEAVSRSYGSASAGAIFAGLRAYGPILSSAVPAYRAGNARYSRVVRAVHVPLQLRTVHKGLAGSGPIRTRTLVVMANAFGRVQTISDVTKLGRLIKPLGDAVSAPRKAWRLAVTDAARAAAVPMPAWARKVGT